jgi:hypothetical protein
MCGRWRRFLVYKTTSAYINKAPFAPAAHQETGAVNHRNAISIPEGKKKVYTTGNAGRSSLLFLCVVKDQPAPTGYVYVLDAQKNVSGFSFIYTYTRTTMNRRILEFDSHPSAGKHDEAKCKFFGQVPHHDFTGNRLRIPPTNRFCNGEDDAQGGARGTGRRSLRFGSDPETVHSGHVVQRPRCVAGQPLIAAR